MTGTLWVWIVFHIFIFGLLALDLGVFHRTAHRVSMKEATIWSCVWIALAMVFNAMLYFWLGAGPALDFLTGYTIEKSLSIDNVFVFALIFSYFRVPHEFQHRVLFWGVIGALIMRAILIIIGATLIAQFQWIFYFFGLLLLVTSVKMIKSKDNEGFDPSNNWLIRTFKRWMPVTDDYEGDKLFARKSGVLHATPLFLVLLVVETSDLIFAIDSIPAVFAITTDYLIVYTSNVFAILGLRSLYFLLVNVIDKFRYLSTGLAVVLAFIGVKMLAMDLYPIPTAVSLAVVLGVITISVLISLRANRIAKVAS